MPSVTIVLNDSAQIATQQATDTLAASSLTFEGIAHTSNPHAEPWVFAVVLGLFLMLVVAFGRSPAWITESVKRMIRNRRDSGLFSGSTVHDFQTRLLLTIFSTATNILFLYSSNFSSQYFSFSIWMVLMLATGIFLIVKNWLVVLIAYVFMIEEEVKKARIYYFSIYSFLGICTYPLLILKLYLNNTDIGIVLFYIVLIVAIVLYLLFVALLFQIFYRKILDLFYILLYLCTLEILPLTGLFLAFRFILNN